MTDLKKSTGMRCPECCATDSTDCRKADCPAKHPGYVLPSRLSDEQIIQAYRTNFNSMPGAARQAPVPTGAGAENIISFARAIEAATASPSAAPFSKQSAIDDVRCWMGDNDVVLKEKAYTELVALVKFYMDRAVSPALPAADAAQPTITRQLHCDLRLAWKLLGDAGHQSVADRVFQFMESKPVADAAQPQQSAEEYLRQRYGAYRGHPEWRALEKAFNAGKAAQPQQVVPEELSYDNRDTGYVRGWNDCRQAVLEAAPPAPQQAEAPRTRLYEMTDTSPDSAKANRQWFFDCDGHYIDVKEEEPGKFSIYFCDRKTDGRAWLDQTAQPDAAEVRKQAIANARDHEREDIGCWLESQSEHDLASQVFAGMERPVNQKRRNAAIEAGRLNRLAAIRALSDKKGGA